MKVRVKIQGTGPPLLVIMGIGGHLDMWEPLAGWFPERSVVMFDFPGTGDSSLPWFPPTMAHCALFVRLLLQNLKLPRADVLGYSWGGLLAQQLAAQHPGTVRKLVLACTGPGVACIPADLEVAARLLTPKRYYCAEYLASIAPDTYGGRFRHDPSLVEAEVARRLHHPPSWAGYTFQLLAAGTFSTFPLASRISQPTLIVAGDDDPIVKVGNQYILKRLIRNSDLRVLKQAGHLLLLDSPERSAPIIEMFLRASN